jgi:hypothetical protein
VSLPACQPVCLSATQLVGATVAVAVAVTAAAAVAAAAVASTAALVSSWCLFLVLVWSSSWSWSDSSVSRGWLGWVGWLLGLMVSWPGWFVGWVDRCVLPGLGRGCQVTWLVGLVGQSLPRRSQHRECLPGWCGGCHVDHRCLGERSHVPCDHALPLTSSGRGKRRILLNTAWARQKTRACVCHRTTCFHR